MTGYQTDSFPCQCPVGSWTEWPCCQGWGLQRRSATWTLAHQDLSGSAHCWVPNLPAAGTNTKSLSGTISSGDQSASYGEAGWLHWTTTIMEKLQLFVLTELDTYFGYEFAFSTCIASAKTTICGLTVCCIHCDGIPHSIASDQGTHFTGKKMSCGVILMECTNLIMFPTILKQLAW